MKYKIIFLIGNLGRGGKERQLVELIKALDPNRYEIHVLSKKGDQYLIDQIESKATSIEFFGGKFFGLNDLVKIRDYILKVKPTIVYGWSSTACHLALLSKLLMKNGFKLVNGSIRSAPIKLNLHRRIEKLLYNFYPYVVSNSMAGLKSYGQFGKLHRYVLYNGINFDRIPSISRSQAKKMLGFPQDKFIVSMTARLDIKEKDYVCYIKGAAECLKRDKDLVFYAIGEGPAINELEALCKSLGLGTSFKFLGKRDDIELILLSSDLTVLCSSPIVGEGISNCILESMACGTPVIATNSGGTPEIIQPGKNGYLVRPGDYMELSDAIIKLKNDKDELQRISIESVKTVREKFEMGLTVQKFDAIVADIYKEPLASIPL